MLRVQNETNYVFSSEPPFNNSLTLLFPLFPSWNQYGLKPGACVIIKVTGDFSSQCAVTLRGHDGIVCGRGLVNYSRYERHSSPVLHPLVVCIVKSKGVLRLFDTQYICSRSCLPPVHSFNVVSACHSPYTHTPIHNHFNHSFNVVSACHHSYTHTPIHPFTHSPIHPYNHFNHSNHSVTSCVCWLVRSRMSLDRSSRRAV